MIGRRLPLGRWWLALWLPLLLLLTTPATARTVAIVRPPASSPALTETVTRLRGELLAVGLSVQVVRRSATTDDSASRVWFRDLTAGAEFVALIEVVGDAPPFAVDVWVLTKTPTPARVSRVDVDPSTENPSEELAIRAIEVLRSAFIEDDLAASERRRKPNDEPPPTVRNDDPPKHESAAWGLAGGVAALTGVDGVGPAIMPVARLDFALPPSLAFEVAFAGFGSRPVVASTTDSARITQKYGVIGARYRFLPGESLRPFLGLAGGVLNTAVEGQAEPPRVERSEDQWSFLLQASTGVDLQLFERYYSSLTGHVHMAEPSVAVHILDTIVATSGRPNLALTLTLGGWL